MAGSIEFKYCHDVLNDAAFKDEPCDNCGRTPTLLGVYFGSDRELNAVCVDCWVSGQVTVHVPRYLINSLRENVKVSHPDWSKGQVESKVDQAVSDLSRTPQVPWIQNNDWVICHGDFTCYLGEWKQDRLISEAPDGDGKEYPFSLLDPTHHPGRDSLEDLWESVAADWTAVYVFQCLKCFRRVAVVQMYQLFTVITIRIALYEWARQDALASSRSSPASQSQGCSSHVIMQVLLVHTGGGSEYLFVHPKGNTKR